MGINSGFKGLNIHFISVAAFFLCQEHKKKVSVHCKKVDYLYLLLIYIGFKCIL